MQRHISKEVSIGLRSKNEEAVAEYNQCLALDPTNTKALHGFARALQELNRFDESVTACQRLTQLEPDDPLSFTALSIAPA